MNDVLVHARTVLETTPARWSSLVSSVTSELLTLAPAPGEWSAAECLQHLVDTERWVFPTRIRALLGGLDFPAFDPEKQGSKPGEQQPVGLADEFARLRGESLAVLGRVMPDDLPRQARHSELGLVTLEQLLHEWAGHDLMHTVQAERALMQPFIRGCGPWRSYFADHDIDLVKLA
ncbi:MAG: DinB family protein [Chloroflexi bacterium]|nr:DinB family protein [Chloroflexota bacterium]